MLLAEVRDRGQVVVGGTATPTALMIGSTITSATVSGPSPRMVVSMFFTQASSQLVGSRPNGQR